MGINNNRSPASKPDVSESLKAFLTTLTQAAPGIPGKRKKLSDELAALLASGDEQEKICRALIKQAQKGDVRALETVMNIIGEKPADSKAAEMDKSVREALETLAGIIRNPMPNRELPEDGDEP